MNVEDFYVQRPIELKFIPDNINFKMTRVSDTTVEFKIYNQAIEINKNLKSNKKITKSVRVILPDSPYIDIKKYEPILKMILAQAQGLANKNDKSFTDKELKKITVLGKKTGLHWKLQDRNHSFLARLLSFLSWIGLTKFIHCRKKQGVVELTLKEYLPWYKKLLYLFNKKRRAAIRSFRSSQQIPKIDLSPTTTTNVNKNFHSFNKIATHAYKYLEKDFDGHDYDDINHISSNFVFVLKDGSLTLINKEKVTEELKAFSNSAVELYKKEIIKEFGKEKCDYLACLARIDFQNLKTLTPEHVYRMNVLACNVEQQDIKLLLNKMLFIKSFLKEKTNDSLLDALNTVNPGILSNYEIRAIVKWTKQKASLTDLSKITTKDFIDSLNSLHLQKNLSYKLSMINSIISNEETPPKGQLIDYLKSNFLVKNLFYNKEDFQKFYATIQQFMPTVENGDLVENFSKLSQSIYSLKTHKEEDAVLQKIIFDKLDENQALINPKAESDIKRILHSLESQETNLSLKEVNQLINALFPTEEEQKRAYTGRGIVLPIESYYTRGGRKFYKPWKDQEEASHAFSILKKDTFFDPYENKEVPLTQKLKERRFDELATHILCKKHEFRQHPTEGYRVGALIPAISKEDGTERYYRVDRMISNDQGLLFYILEPVGKDNDLPTYILPRSTASDRYAFKGLESFRNDLNPLNAPGYEGRRYLTPYMEKVRKDHTIPLWVGYLHSAENELLKTSFDLQKIQNQLNNAKEILTNDTYKSFSRKSLHEIIREFDSEINDFFWYNASYGELAKRWLTPLKTQRSEYERIITSFANNYSKQQLEKETEEEKNIRINKEENDVKFIISYINKFAQKNEQGEISIRHQELIRALEENICNPTTLSKNEILEKNLPEEVQIAFQRIEQYPENIENLKIAIDLLKNYAQSIGEDIESKKTNGLAISGHSLGGSTAQVEAYYATLGTNRIPVPNTRMKVSLYDDPGMNEEDNIDFYQKAFRHRDLLKELNSTIKVYHSHDYGDIIPMGAPAHLGGINKTVMDELYRLCEEAILKDEKTTDSPLTQSFKKAKKDPNNEIDHERPLSEIFYSGEKGKRQILSFFLEKLNHVLEISVELKKTTKRALEPETVDIAFKHGTRFETSKIEKTSIFKTAVEAKKRLACRKEEVNFRVLGSFILNKIDEFKDQENFNDFVTAFSSFENIKNYLKKCGKITNIEDFLPKDHRLSNMRVFEKKHLNLLKKQCERDFATLLKFAKNKYFDLLEREIEKSLEQSLGGVRLTYLDPFILGGLGGGGLLSIDESRAIWGGGAVDHKRLRKIARLIVNLGPFIFPSISSAKSKKEYICNNGHGAALQYENPIYNTFVVDAEVGVM